MFYVHLQPTLLFALVFNIAGFYFIKKYLLFRRCKIPDVTDLVVFETCINSMMYAPIIYGTGSLLFTLLQNPDSNFVTILPCILCILVAPFAMLDPFNLIDSLTGKIIQLISNDS